MTQVIAKMPSENSNMRLLEESQMGTWQIVHGQATAGGVAPAVVRSKEWPPSSQKSSVIPDRPDVEDLLPNGD